ncbi:MAG: glycine/betaine/sarcosine/D-proline family reductase selenoprotein B [bacterium]
MGAGRKIRIVHYLNQFFAGVGGEEESDHPLTLKEGPVGPGLLLQKILAGEGEVAATLFCGDSAFSSDEEAFADAALAHIRRLAPDLLIAGPAFNAGRYGLACARLCRAALGAGVPALTAMHPENPGVAACRREIRVVPAAETAAGMEEALHGLARLGLKLARGERVGAAAEEGYLPRGIRYNEISEVPTAQRAVDMVLKKIKGEPFVSELIVEKLDEVPPPPPIGDLESAVIAVVSEGGMVPPDNPDRIPGSRASNWGKYTFAGLDELPEGSFISIHGGYNTVFVNEDPDRIIPVDALRRLEREGAIAGLHDTFLSTCGNGGGYGDMQEVGRAWVKELRAMGVTGVVLPAT